MEKRYVRKSGELFWVSLNVSTIVVEGKEIFISQVQNIHDKKVNEENLKQTAMELQESEERFKLDVEGSVAGVWDWFQVYGEEVWWSQQFFDLIGYDISELEPSLSSFKYLLHPDDVEPTFQALEDHFQKDIQYDVDTV